MFYPGDWFKDPAVQRLTLEEKGAWIELLFYMNEANERGKIPIEGIENILGISQAKSSKLLANLQAKGVANIEQNFIVCRRMLREQNLKEIRRKAGSKGGSKTQANLKQDPKLNQALSSSSSSSSSIKKEKIARSGKPKRAVAMADNEFVKALKENPAYEGIDIEREIGKLDAWLLTPRGRGKKRTQQRLINWLNRAEQPMESIPQSILDKIGRGNG